ncbi:MAG: bifunctional glutamate--cysteine ligase GshA/glutathione synthetase GshB [Spirochaetales bacterium]|nr:bifunctional glutamate--cysteine ligase GshA/glutathione synthetase GshB [Spirochaetales bacterium]
MSAPRGFATPGFEDLEISTQLLIADAQARDIAIEVLDRPGHFLRLRKNDRVEYVKQASKTRLDSYVSFLMMEDKWVSKILLREKGLSVPTAEQFHDVETARAAYSRIQDRPTVLKPVFTNFGVGITMFASAFSKTDYNAALDTAFAEGPAVLVEELVSGEEYRFLVLGDQCVAVCNRVPANVIGDGNRTIAQLVTEKNQDPRRGQGHRTPLEKIQLGSVELSYLNTQGLNPDSIPDRNKTVYLRKNSNISTGGDSHDVTDLFGDDYREIAVRATKAVGAAICGVDIIVPDPKMPAGTSGAYSILELNFNPVLYIHNFPYLGKNRDVGNRLLDLLGF